MNNLHLLPFKKGNFIIRVHCVIFYVRIKLADFNKTHFFAKKLNRKLEITIIKEDL